MDYKLLLVPLIYFYKQGKVVPSQNGQITYFIANGNGDFSIDSHTGEICVVRALDREAISQYQVF